MRPDLDYRSTAGLELRAEEGKDPVIHGHFAVFDSLSEPIMWFKEELKPGCFRQALKERTDIICLNNHIAKEVLGNTGSPSKTLRLKEDERGLFGECDVAPTSYGNDLVISMKRGDTRHASFGFYPVKYKWRLEDGWDIREMYVCDLVEVTVTAFPRYKATELGVRSYLPPGKVEKEMLLCRALNRAEHHLDLNDEDKSVLREYRSLYVERLPLEVRGAVDSILGHGAIMHSVPPSAPEQRSAVTPEVMKTWLDTVS